MKKLFLVLAFIPSLLMAQDPCTLIPDPGPCMAMVPKFYFDQNLQQCTMFVWGGCGGIVPFNSLAECEASACTSAVDSCEAEYIEGCLSIGLWDPVCGCDGVTYSNFAEAECYSISDYTMGECDTSADVYGCTDNTAINYNPLATVDDGSCMYMEIPGCTDPSATNYNPMATTDDGSCIYLVFGCMDSLACNYDSEANTSDFSCEYPEPYYDCSGNCLNDGDGDLVCDEVDNCLLISNPDQMDSDLDGEGDACDYDDGLELDELQKNNSPLLKIVDVLGREHSYHPKGKILFYIYKDGHTEKKIKY